MKNVSVLIKPASSLCNMNCTYCFYRDEAVNRETPSYGLMTYDTADSIIKKFLDISEISCHFAFQGGEPTLAGIEFYKYFVSKVESCNTKKIKVSYSIQTNGFDVSKDFISFFSENDFLVGVSLDGYKAIHDYNRVTESGNGTFSQVIETVNRLKSAGVKYNILSVVTNESTKHTEKILNFFTEKECKYLQFIPCLDEIKKADSFTRLSEQNYADFLIKTINYISKLPEESRPHIRFFDNLFSMLKGGTPESCNMCGRCTIQFVVESNGNVYPCDFYCTDEYLLGNINKVSPEQILQCRSAVTFISESLPVPDECSDCRYYPLCRNGCKRERSKGKTIHCEAYKKLYNTILKG